MPVIIATSTWSNERIRDELGGDAKVFGHYDYFTNRVSAGGVVNELGDCRGISVNGISGSAGPALISGSTGAPTDDVANQQITNATTKTLTTAVVARYSASVPISLVAFGTQNVTSNTCAGGLASDIGDATWLVFLINNTTSNVAVRSGNADTTTDLGILANANIYRVMLATVTGPTSTNIQGAIVNHAVQSTAGANNALGHNQALTVFNYWPAGTDLAAAACSGRGWLVFDHVPSAGELDALGKYGQARYGCTLAI